MKTSLRLAAVLLALAAGSGLALAADEPPGVDVKVADDHVDFLVGKELAGRYHTGPGIAKPYFWPLYAPGQVPVTRGWPMEKMQPGGTVDHIHQKSAWFCHGDVVPEGDAFETKKPVDFWSETLGHGRIVCIKVDPPEEPPAGDKNHGKITTHNEWRSAGGEKIVDETRIIHFHSLGEARLFVFDIDLHASVGPVTFGDTKEGSFGVRVNDAIREGKGTGKIENADGKIGEKECWGQRSAWCDYSGTSAGKTVGIAVFDDPANPSPSCWHSRAYGLMAANPFGRSKSGFPAVKDKTDLVKLAKGEHLKLRYGLLLHPGDAKEGKVAKYFDQFLVVRPGGSSSAPLPKEADRKP